MDKLSVNIDLSSVDPWIFSMRMVEGALKLMTNSSDFTKKHEILTPEQQFVSKFVLSRFLDLFVLKKV